MIGAITTVGGKLSRATRLRGKRKELSASHSASRPVPGLWLLEKRKLKRFSYEEDADGLAPLMDVSRESGDYTPPSHPRGGMAVVEDGHVVDHAV